MQIRKYNMNLFLKMIDFNYGIRHLLASGRLLIILRDFEEKIQMICNIDKKNVPLQRISKSYLLWIELVVS